MKIRILDNSIRIRFSQKELDQLFESGQVECQTQFPNQQSLIYRLKSSTDVSALSADLSNNQITIHIPKSSVDELHQSNKVGIEAVVHDLKLLVEKDFKCLTERDEDESDLFENPMKKESC